MSSGPGHDPSPKIEVKVTVVIVNWNGEKFLKRCLTAVMDQTMKPHEIILVDNASSDRSLEIAREFPSVRLMALERNTGFAQGNNLAIETASGVSQWIALINPDAFAEPRWLEELLRATKSKPGGDIFGSKLLTAANLSVMDGAGDAYHMSGLVWRIGHGAPVTTSAGLGSEVFSVCAAAALYRRSALQKTGGLDEDYFCYSEDVDLGFRLRLAGHKAMYVPEAVVHHIGSASTGGQHSDFSVYHGHRNLVWTFVKNMPGALFWLLLPLHLLMNLVTVAVFIARGQGAVILRAKRDAIKGLPQAWAKRKQIQARRVATIGEIWRVLDKSLIYRKKSRG